MEAKDEEVNSDSVSDSDSDVGSENNNVSVSDFNLIISSFMLMKIF